MSLPSKDKSLLDKFKKMLQEGLEEGLKDPVKYENARRDLEKRFKSTIGNPKKSKGDKEASLVYRVAFSSGKDE